MDEAADRRASRMAGAAIRNLVESGAATGIPATLRALLKARIWCLAPHQVIDRLVADPLVPYEERRLLTARLAEEKLSPQDLNRLQDLVGRLEQLGQGRGRPTGSVYSTLRDILQFLPREERVSRCLAYLQSNRWQQRAMACRVLRDEELDESEVAALCRTIPGKPNRLLVELAARHSGRLSAADALEVVLPRLDNEYWQSRVVEKLLPRPEVEISRVATEWPLAVLWALGRNRWTAYLPLVTGILPGLEKDWKRLPIVTWALGRLGAARELDDLERNMRNTPDWRAYSELYSGMDAAVAVETPASPIAAG
jgi:hypothetical protein